MGKMNGQVFEKVGVNVSQVWGEFKPEFAEKHQGRQRGPTILGLRHFSSGPHVQPQSARGSYEYTDDLHDNQLVWWRSGLNANGAQ